jgi:transposase
VTRIICGVDVSSQWLDARIGREGPFERFASTPEGIEALAAFCTAHGVELVAMEATGGYEKRPFALLWARGIAAAIVNPRAVRRFAEAMGLLEKTDRIDAGVIAWYAQTKHIVACAPATPTQQCLQALVTRLRQLTELRTAQLNQRRLLSEGRVLAGFEEMLGVARLMAEMPEIGTLSNKAAAKLAGLAPLARDSGKSNGKRPIRGGRSGIRSILFVVAEIVRRYDPDFADFHKRLNSAGKPKKVIRIALAHKLLVRLNAKARDARSQLARPA